MTTVFKPLLEDERTVWGGLWHRKADVIDLDMDNDAEEGHAAKRRLKHLDSSCGICCSH